MLMQLYLVQRGPQGWRSLLGTRNQQINPMTNRCSFRFLQVLLVEGLVCTRVLAYNMHQHGKW